MLPDPTNHAHSVRLDIVEDADRLHEAAYIEDILLSGVACILRVVEDGGVWLRVLLGDDDLAVWVPDRF